MLINSRAVGVGFAIICPEVIESPKSIFCLNNLLVVTATGQPVPLASIATIKEVDKAQNIQFLNGERVVGYKVSLEVDPEERSAVAAQLETSLKDYLTEEKLEMALGS